MNNISKNILSVFAAVAAVTASGAEAVKSVVPFEVKKEPLKVNFDADCREFVIPELKKAPTLKDFPKDWANAVKMSDFKTIYRRAEMRAKALQAAGEWKKFLPKTLTPPEDTIVYMGYDKDNLYLATECCESPGNVLTKLPGLPRDSKIYSVDSIELMIFKDRANPDFVQLMADMLGQIYDAKRNDVARTTDVSWNPDYKLEVGKKGENWILFWTFPWKMLEIQPVAGREFALNIARNKRHGKEFSSLAGNKNGFAERDRLVKMYIGKKNPRCSVSAVTAPALVEGKNFLTVWVNNPTAQKVDAQVRLKCGKASNTKPITLKPNAKSKLRLSISGVVKSATMGHRVRESGNRIDIELLDKEGKLINSAMFTADAMEKMAVSLASYAVMGSEDTLNCRVQINCGVTKTAKLEISCNGNKSLLAPKSGEYLLDVSQIQGDAEVVIRLFDSKTNKNIVVKKLKFTREADPFA